MVSKEQNLENNSNKIQNLDQNENQNQNNNYSNLNQTNVPNLSNHVESHQFNKYISNNEVFEDKVINKLQLRKAAHKQELENRRRKLKENLEGELEIHINVNSLKIDFSKVKQEISSFTEIFNLLSYALDQKDMDLFKFYIYTFRVYLTKVDINVNIDDYFNNTENFLNLIELFEFYYKQNEVSITYEIMWIFTNVFNNIQNTKLQSLLFTQKLVKIIAEILYSTKFEKSSEYFIYLCFMITGNAVQFSPSNRELIFESNIAIFIRQFFTEKYQNYSLNILKIICWVCSLFFSSSRELDYETVRFFIYF